MTQGKVEFRIIADADAEFVYQVYASTRDWEMAHSTWTDADREQFLRGQFKLQSRSYALNHIGATHRIITLDGVDIGRIIVHRADDHLRLIDLAILPAFRGRGIGTDILRALMGEAAGGKVPMRLHADKQSPAIRLYARHGFRRIADQGHYLELEWQPNLAPQAI